MTDAPDPAPAATPEPIPYWKALEGEVTALRAKVQALERERDAIITEVKGLGIVYYDDGVVPGLRNDRAEAAEREVARLKEKNSDV